MNRIGIWGPLAVLAMVFIGGFIGYVWLPRVQYAGQGFFAAWCSALGVPRSWAASGETPRTETAASEVILTQDLPRSIRGADSGHGATLALRCTMCHGPRGISYAGAPNLSGQFATVVYKELRDYASSARPNTLMSAMARSLSDTQMREVAAYYASLPRPARGEPAAAPPPIVKWGAPMRNIPPCGSCHGGMDHTLASPWLAGEPATYIHTELAKFASDERHNDINAQMRAVARNMSGEEMAQAAAYYAGDAR